MNYQRDRTLLETTTSMAPADVLAAAKEFFSRRPSIYTAFIEKESDTHVGMRGQGGEELIIGVRPAEGGGTAVTGSTYMFDQQIGRFFTTLPPVEQKVASAPELPASGGTSDGEHSEVTA